MDTEDSVASSAMDQTKGESKEPPKKRQKAQRSTKTKATSSELVCGVPLRGESMEAPPMPDISDFQPSSVSPSKGRKRSKTTKPSGDAVNDIEEPAIPNGKEKSPAKKRGVRQPFPPSREKPKREIKPVKEIYVNNSVGPKFRSKNTRASWVPTYKYWSDDELKKFLGLIQKHGATKVLSENLMKERTLDEQRRLLNVTTAPARHKTRSIVTYERYSNMLEKVVVREQEDVKAPVTQWIEKLLNTGEGALNAKALTKALLFIAEFEDHPPPSECDGVDFAAIYRYLAELSIGGIPADLNCESAAVVLDLMRDLATQVAPLVSVGKEYTKQIDEVEIWLPELQRTPTVCEPTFEQLEEVEAVRSGDIDELIASFVQTPGLNPLKLDLSVLEMKNLTKNASA